MNDKAKCKWLTDDGYAKCKNPDSPMNNDYCPCLNFPEICRYSDKEEREKS